MSRFQIGDLIRHRTGVKLFRVHPSSVSCGLYTVKPEGAEPGVFQPMDVGSVDANYILYERRIQDEVITEDPQRVMQWRDEVPCGQDYRVHMPLGPRKTWYIKPLGVRFEGYGGPVIPLKISRDWELPADVAVTLEGIPQGYYLKAFRVAGPADLIIKTNGVVCGETKRFCGKQSLLRPIVAKIPEAKSCVPGIPAEFELVRVGTPHPGDLFIDAIGGFAECVKPSPTSSRPIVRKKVGLQPCNGILPGIPLGFTVVRFGDVSPEEFYFDTVGTLKQGPSKNRLVLKKVKPPSNVDWGVVDRKVRNDAADAAAYAHMQQCENRVHRVKTERVDVTDADPTVQVEKEYKLNGARLTVWVADPVSPIFFGVMAPTGRSRKVKVI